MAQAAKLKGISLLGTGDFLHHLWFTELERDLKELGNGFFENSGVRFALSCEVSLIYSHLGRGRRIHLIVMLPALENVSKLHAELSKRGAKLSSDGRPILGMSSQAFCEIVFNINPLAIIIPAHIWTPWFGMFGSQSGYDSFEDCFGEFSEKIYAIETGLSSDPAMNWRVGQLDKKVIVSFSDLHSLSKMGREATVFKSDLKLGYTGLLKDLKEQGIEETIEFYPEEGKYHYDGHRNCNYSQEPEKTRQNGIVCPVCGRDLTIGVMYRVDKLATRNEEEAKALKRPGYRMLVPLLEIIAETFHTGISSQKVLVEYKKLTGSLSPEIEILTDISLEEIAKISGEEIAKAVEKVRTGDLVIKPGYDGVYGVVKIWNDEKELKSPQIGLFE